MDRPGRTTDTSWTAGTSSYSAARAEDQESARAAASELLILGIDPTAVAKLLGSSVEMLTRHYAHLLTDHLANAASKAIGRKRTR